jgi:hypothetical protein
MIGVDTNESEGILKEMSVNDWNSFTICEAFERDEYK